ncbi:MAG: hypothetical protein O3A46_05710 [Candidatus Poribacteria bacterium]|nr:hypothetical protein [Candidatus Poribacteria bacterium]
MNYRVYLHDLNADCITRIRDALRVDLVEEIEQAVASGVERETAEIEVVDDYLNRHNVGWELEI